jgi:hypothetical protein
MEIAQEKRTRTCRFRCENLRRKREISWRIATWCTRDRWFLVILRRFGVTAVNCSNSIGDISIKRGIREDESGRLLINVGPVSATKTSCSDLRPLRVSFDLSHLSKPEWDVGKFCFRGRCQKQQTDPTNEPALGATNTPTSRSHPACNFRIQVAIIRNLFTSVSTGWSVLESFYTRVKWFVKTLLHLIGRRVLRLTWRCCDSGVGRSSFAQISINTCPTRDTPVPDK